MLVVLASDDSFHLGVLQSRIHTVWALRAGGWLGIGNDPRYSKTRCFDPFPFPEVTEKQQREIKTRAERLDSHRKLQRAEHPNLLLTEMYNVLEQVRAGVKPDALTVDERQIFDDGLILILKELHDRLDAAVADAYGWPLDLDDEEILRRLVALNRERAAEEARGVVRWLRPDYQVPRFGSPREKARQLEADLVAPDAKAAKPSFPADDMAQTAAVMAALANSARPLDAAAMAATFRQGKRVEAKVRAVLTALARMGFVATPDGGRTFLLRKAS
jgi:hypothetical protein